MAPAPSVLTWSKPTGMGKTKTAGATFQGRKIAVQTPTFPAKIYRDDHAGSTTLYLRLEGELGDAFSEFLDSYERHASEFELGERSSCLRNGSFRISIWDDAQWFDEDGTHVPDSRTLTGTSAAACILEFGGCWITAAGRWGLKWRAMQILCASLPPTPSTSPTEEEPAAAAAAAYAFMDDDDGGDL